MVGFFSIGLMSQLYCSVSLIPGTVLQVSRYNFKLYHQNIEWVATPKSTPTPSIYLAFMMDFALHL